MQRMGVLDAAFLDAEDEDRHTSMAIASIAVFEGPAPSYDEFCDVVKDRLPLVPRYRQKVRPVPLDLGPPLWVDDPHFDLAYHVRETALPAPGGEEQLARLMGRLMANRLDREHPLWESWLVQGLADDQWAVIAKVHHCMVDGVSGTDLYRVFYNDSPEPTPPVPDDWEPEQEPSTWRVTLDSLGGLVSSQVAQVRAVEQAVLHHPGDAARRVGDAVRGLTTLAGVLVPAKRSSLSGPIGAQRRFTWAEATMEDVRTVRRGLGGSLNDVVLAAVTGGFRALLLARGEQPSAHAIRSLVPVSARTPGAESIYDNRVTCLLAFLPVDVADPVERLAAVRAHLDDLKASKEAEAGSSMTALGGYEPYPLVAGGIRAAYHLPQRSIVTVTTNVPGPRHALYACGRRLRKIIPYVPISTTVRTGVAIFTYNDHVTFGITGDYDTAPDLAVLAQGIGESLGDLVKAAEERAGG